MKIFNIKILNRVDKILIHRLLKLAFPIMFGNFIQTIYNLTDAFFLGKLGKDYLSAPAIAFNIVFLLIVFGAGLSMANTTMISQAIGKKDKKLANHFLNQSLYILGFVSIILSTIGIILSPYILKLLNTPDKIFNLTNQYTKIVFAGIPFMFGFFLFQSTMFGLGDSITPMKIQIVSVIVNIILDPILIFGLFGLPALDVRGAAIATVFSRFVSSIISFIILFKGKNEVKLRLGEKFDFKVFKIYFKIGMPASIGQGLSALGFTVLQGVVNYFDTAVIAAFAVGNRIIGLFNMPSMGFSRATTTLVGNSIGAKNYDRVNRILKVALISILSFIIPSMILIFFFGGYVIKFFVNDPETIKWGKILFKVVSPSVVFFAIFQIINGAFQGAGDTKPVMFFNIMRLWGIRVPIAFLLAIKLGVGPMGIWIAMFLSNTITSLLGLYWFKKEKWRDIAPIHHT